MSSDRAVKSNKVRQPVQVQAGDSDLTKPNLTLSELYMSALLIFFFF